MFVPLLAAVWINTAIPVQNVTLEGDLTKLIGTKPEMIYQHPLSCADERDQYFDTKEYGQIPVCYSEKIDCAEAYLSSNLLVRTSNDPTNNSVNQPKARDPTLSLVI